MITDLPLLAEVQDIEPLTETILRIILKPQHFVAYTAGQYLQILTPEEALAYSIANAPLGARHYEIHLRHRPQDTVHQHLLHEMRVQGVLPIFLPLGQCHVGVLSANQSTLMLVQGTGFAQMKAILEQWLADGTLPLVKFIWLAKTPADWYMQSLLDNWAHHHGQFHYDLWSTALSNDHIVTEAFKLMHPEQVIFAGDFERMRLLRQIMLTSYHISQSQCYADAFGE